jgi:hypothetical protein
MTAVDDPSPKRASFPLSVADIDAFAVRSPGLVEILKSDEAVRIVTAYRREDLRAIEEQARFATVAARLNRSVLASAVTGAVILALGVLNPWFAENAATEIVKLITWLVAALGFVGLLIGGYAAALLYELNAGDLARDWTESRARAERLRGEYFDRLVARVASADTAAQVAALDLVIKHLLEDQLAYFGERGNRHESAAGRWLRLAAFSTGVASVGVAAGGMVGAVGGPWLLAIAALGAIGTAVVSFAASQESIGQERERAQRFRNNVDALELLARKSEDVREAVGKSATDALVTFTTAIIQQLALELGRFLEGGESVRASITKLSQQIEQSRKKDGEIGVPEDKSAAEQKHEG